MDNTAIVRRWFEEVWNQGREAAIDELMAPDAAVHGVGGPGQVHHGPAEFKPFWAQLRAAFPDIRSTMDDLISQGDMVAGRWTAHMTHTGNQLGVAATRKALTITGMVFARINGGEDGGRLELVGPADLHARTRAADHGAGLTVAKIAAGYCSFCNRQKIHHPVRKGL